jgi:hypothetical protein
LAASDPRARKRSNVPGFRIFHDKRITCSSRTGIRADIRAGGRIVLLAGGSSTFQWGAHTRNNAQLFQRLEINRGR